MDIVLASKYTDPKTAVYAKQPSSERQVAGSGKVGREQEIVH